VEDQPGSNYAARSVIKDVPRITQPPSLHPPPLAQVRDVHAQDHELLEPEIYSDDEKKHQYDLNPSSSTFYQKMR
jgi:hypothetical protein